MSSSTALLEQYLKAQGSITGSHYEEEDEFEATSSFRDPGQQHQGVLPDKDPALHIEHSLAQLEQQLIRSQLREPLSSLTTNTQRSTHLDRHGVGSSTTGVIIPDAFTTTTCSSQVASILKEWEQLKCRHSALLKPMAHPALGRSTHNNNFLASTPPASFSSYHRPYTASGETAVRTFIQQPGFSAPCAASQPGLSPRRDMSPWDLQRPATSASATMLHTRHLSNPHPPPETPHALPAPLAHTAHHHSSPQHPLGPAHSSSSAAHHPAHPPFRPQATRSVGVQTDPWTVADNATNQLTAAGKRSAARNSSGASIAAHDVVTRLLSDPELTNALVSRLQQLLVFKPAITPSPAAANTHTPAAAHHLATSSPQQPAPLSPPLPATQHNTPPAAVSAPAYHTTAQHTAAPLQLLPPPPPAHTPLPSLPPVEGASHPITHTSPIQPPAAVDTPYAQPQDDDQPCTEPFPNTQQQQQPVNTQPPLPAPTLHQTSLLAGLPGSDHVAAGLLASAQGAREQAAWLPPLPPLLAKRLQQHVLRKMSRDRGSRKHRAHRTRAAAASRKVQSTGALLSSSGSSSDHSGDGD